MDNCKVRQNPFCWILSCLLKKSPSSRLSYILKSSLEFWGLSKWKRNFWWFISSPFSKKEFNRKITRFWRSIQTLWLQSPDTFSCGWRRASSVVGVASGCWCSRQCGTSTCIQALLFRWGEIPTCGSTIKYVTLFHEMSYFSHIIRSCGLCYHEVTIFCSLFGKISSPFSLMPS